MTINNSVLEGYTGLVVKGGRVDVIDTTVNGTGNYGDTVDNPSGFSDTGDGILLESSYTYGPATVNVSGDKTVVVSKNAYAIRMFKGSGTEPLEINVTGGRYSTRRLTDGGNDVDMTYADVSAFVPAGREQILTYDGYYMITALEVKDRETLAEIVENSVRANVKLAGDVVLTSPLDIRSESSISIDLNGYSITYTGGNIFNAEPSSSLTIINGDLVGGGTNNAIQAIGAEVVLSNIEITEVFDVIKIADSLNASNAEAMIHVVSSKLTGSNSAISVQASDTNSAKISVIVENSTLVGENFVGIAGSESRSNIDIQITNSTIKGGQTSIYHPQSDSTMTVTSSTLEGKTGLVVKGGTVNVIDSTVTATGASAEPTEKTTGFNSTGDGILLESASNYGPATINVSGDETLVTSANAKAVRLFAGSGLSPLKINISGGNYSTSVNGYIAEGYTETETNGSYKITANS